MTMQFSARGVFTLDGTSVEDALDAGGGGGLVPEDSLGLLDPDTIDATVDAIASTLDGYGVTVPDEAIAQVKAGFAAAITEDPTDTVAAVTNAAIAVQLLEMGALASQVQVAGLGSSLADLSTALDAGGKTPGSALWRSLYGLVPANIAYSGKYLRVFGNEGDQFTGPALAADWSGDVIQVRGLVRYWHGSPLAAAYGEWSTCVGADPAHDLWESAVFNDGGRLMSFQESTPQGGDHEVGNIFAPGGIAPGQWFEEIHEVNKGGDRVIYRRMFDSPGWASTVQGDKWVEVARNPMVEGDYWVADPTGLPWAVGAGNTSKIDVARMTVTDGSGLLLGVDAEDATDDVTVPDLVSGTWEANGSAGVLHTDDDPVLVPVDPALLSTAAAAVAALSSGDVQDALSALLEVLTP